MSLSTTRRRERLIRSSRRDAATCISMTSSFGTGKVHIMVWDWKSVTAAEPPGNRILYGPSTGRDRRNRGGGDVLGLAAQELVSNLPTSALSKGRDDDPLLHYSCQWPKFNLAVK